MNSFLVTSPSFELSKAWKACYIDEYRAFITDEMYEII